MRNSYRKWMIVMIMVTFMAGLMACQTPAGRSAGGVVDDSTITSKVKAKLFGDESLSGFAIDVDTFKGEVTLTGGVKTEADIQHATELAKQVEGVKNVNNFLKVKK
ncbi:MAG: transporter [Deltaproteobacteria bacterium HGW-Deltaproteobacteria-15]|nr:MAG: transporter [Deltaproteobacteria bacterium HGW-Deltaproteobacteria-15]